MEPNPIRALNEAKDLPRLRPFKFEELPNLHKTGIHTLLRYRFLSWWDRLTAAQQRCTFMTGSFLAMALIVWIVLGGVR